MLISPARFESFLRASTRKSCTPCPRRTVAALPSQDNHTLPTCGCWKTSNDLRCRLSDETLGSFSTQSITLHISTQHTRAPRSKLQTTHLQSAPDPPQPGPCDGRQSEVPTALTHHICY